MRRHVHAAIGDCAHHGYKLNGRHAHLLPDGERQDAGRAPLSWALQKTARLAGQFDARTVSEAIGLDVLVEGFGADFQRHLCRANVTGMLQRILHRHAAEVVGLVVVQGAPIHGHRAVLAVHHVVRLHTGGVESGRVSDQLEGRARLIHIAHRQVGQRARLHVTRVVGIEARRDRKRQDLPGMRVLHHHRAVRRLHLGHLLVQRALGHVLNVGVDGEHQIVARQRLVLHAAHHVALGVHRGQHVAGRAMHLVVELLLQSAQSRVVGAHITQHLRGKIVVGIEALELLLEIDALQVQLAHAIRSVRIDASRHPRKVLRIVEARQNLLLRCEVVAWGRSAPSGPASPPPRRDSRPSPMASAKTESTDTVMASSRRLRS